jgi:lysine biosynthesis protein LysW
MATTYCPECEGTIVVNPPLVGKKLTCPHCEVELEVISADPLELDWAYDWEWDDDEYDDSDDDWDDDEDDDY